jgi:MoaA/NifB/PqqE/SkfB family radical SAM enzyme
MSRVCHFYVTLRCNDTCEFCSCWRDNPPPLPGEPAKEEKELGLAGLEPLLRRLRREGIKTLNITGGEPLLRQDLPAILKLAKELGFQRTLTTNGILYPERAEALKGLSEQLFFSLDHPYAEGHDQSRGTVCFEKVLAGIKIARQLGERVLINYTLTRDNVRFLPEMVELAERLGVFLQLNPVYDFAGTQGFTKMTLEHIRYYARRRHVLVDLATLLFIEAGGNKTFLPRCRAKETTVTILPDGSRATPCFFNQGGVEGRSDVCSSCLRWPYMLPSFTLGLDKYRWWHGYSELLNRRKLGLNKGGLL